MNDKKIIDNKEVYNNFLDRAVAMAKQGKRPNILTPAFYDAVRIGKDFFDLSQEEVYNHIEQKLEGEMREETSQKDLDTQKALNKEKEKTIDLQKQIKDISENDAVAKIPNSALTAINQQVKNPATMAALVLDFIEKIQEKESIQFDNNSKFKQALQRLEDLAKSTRKEDTEDVEESLVKEITKRVKERLSEANIKEMDLRKGDVVKFKDGSNITEDQLRDAEEALEKYREEVLGKDEELSLEQKKVERFLKAIAKEFDYSIQDAANFVKSTISKMGLKEMFKEQKTNNHSNPVLEAAKKKLVDRINSIALKEGISKREATIKAIKALKESK